MKTIRTHIRRGALGLAAAAFVAMPAAAEVPSELQVDAGGAPQGYDSATWFTQTASQEGQQAQLIETQIESDARKTDAQEHKVEKDFKTRNQHDFENKPGDRSDGIEDQEENPSDDTNTNTKNKVVLKKKKAVLLLKCNSPCSLGSEGFSLSRLVQNAAEYYAGGSTLLPPFSSPFDGPGGPLGEDHLAQFYLDFYGPTGPRPGEDAVSEAYLGLYGPTGQTSPYDWRSWTQKTQQPLGHGATAYNGAFSSFWGRFVAELGALDLAALTTAAGRGAVLEGLTQRLSQQFPGIDPAVISAVANGAVTDLLNTLGGPNGPAGLTGGGSTGGFTDITLTLPLLFQVFDFGAVDGDIITLTVVDTQGTKLTQTFTMAGPPGDLFAPNVEAGPIEINVTAINEGQFSPNTGQVDILSTVTEGNQTQQFNLQTGETGTLKITANPAPPIN